MADKSFYQGGHQVKLIDNGDGTYRLATDAKITVQDLQISNAALDCAAVAEYNVTLTNANTEYSQALPANCRKLILRCRTADTVRYAWATGKVTTPTAPYQTLKPNVDYSIDGIKIASGIIYLASATAGVVVEMEAWS